MKRLPLLLLLILISITWLSCQRYKRHGLLFGDFKGIHYTEVRRVFTNGQVFDNQGYQLEPVWKFYFVSDDSVQAFAPRMQKYYGFHVYYDHDQIFNMIDSWLQLRKMTKDSLVFRALRVNDKREILEDDEGSKVWMTFYSDDYLKTKKPEELKKMRMPGAKDTAFIRERSKLANSVIDSAFGAREPVVLKSNSPNVVAEKVINKPTPLDDMDPAYDYLYPEYNITIHHSYEAFDYTFSVFIDDKGRMTFGKTNIDYSHEYKKTYEDVMKGIMNGYLVRYLDVTPGKTLGIAHTSTVLLNVVGKKD